MPKVTAYKCDTCGMVRDEPDIFREVMGNIVIPDRGGLVGNNLDDDGKVVKTNIFCVHCLINIIDKNRKNIKE